MVNLAIVGLGHMGQLHLKNIKKLEEEKLCNLTCICDIKKSLTDLYSNKLNVKGYYDVDSMIKEDLFDAAIVVVDSTEHFKVSKKLIEAKKDILVEKPVVVSIKEANVLKRLCEEKKVMLSPGYTELYNDVISDVKNYIEENQFFYLDFFRIGKKNSKNDEKDIDVIQDLMTHDIAVLSEILDITKVKKISGDIGYFNEKSSKYDFSSINLSFDNSIVRFLVDRNGTIKIRNFKLSTEEFYGVFDFMDQKLEIIKKGNIKAFGEKIWYFQNYDSIQIKYFNNPLFEEIKDFVISSSKKINTKVSERWFDVTCLVENIRNLIY
ncbi:Gfo/Idh/MocA family oxidoreductase [Oceanotoga sp.]|uniref:Gfo/Idh/MocA family protein n=1 Tax=Oceanotoga sp. TaxID=2108366 RepID=UPI00280492D2|nr:Gfo/Idh/MocA family oxidoreductase [Oceanotoga sp.]